VPGAGARGLRRTLLHHDRLLLALPAHARPAAPAAVRLADFSDAAWVATRPTAGDRSVAELTFRRAGFVPRVAFRADDYDLLLPLVGAGLGVALVPELLTTPRPGFSTRKWPTPRDSAATSTSPGARAPRPRPSPP
jgi:DNA-binding transcriptional LysR family regulator